MAARTSYYVWWYRAMGVCVFGFMAIGMLGWIESFWPFAGLALPFGWIAVRSSRVGVAFTDEQVVVRGMFRTRTAEWNSIVDVRDTSWSSTGLRWRVPQFVLTDGRIKAEEVRTLRSSDSVVDEVLEAGRRRIADASSRA